MCKAVTAATVAVMWAMCFTVALAQPVECVEGLCPDNSDEIPQGTAIPNDRGEENPTPDPWYIPIPVWSKGVAMYYASGLMEATAEVRGLSLKGFVDGVALMSPADREKVVWLKPPQADWEGPFLVVDCAARTDVYNNIMSKREVVEVGWRTAQRWKMLGPVEVEVSRIPPAELKGSPLDYPVWWSQQLERLER